ncbi:helix-turn-helix transcriptional regulator [Brevundimonas bacteroides]|uniref:helix-turn-helix transcriptional regulator n=1 Tax=Brevundimonas bacteroides TaxID=74311 RepID=UPI000B0DCD5F|nr:AraC family transcriptional regulator [Brevundimonas bacteroides]
MTAPTTPASVRIDAALDPRDRFENWREAVSAVFDMEVADTTAFDCGMTSWKLGQLVLGGFWSTGNAFVRDRRKIAASGVEHYVVQTLIQGRSVVREGAVEGDWPVGSVRILDMTRPIRTQADAFSNLTLIMPRPVLEPLLGAPDDLHGATLAPDSVGAGVLRRLLRDLSDHAASMTEVEAQALGPGVAAMVASCFGPSVAAAEAARAHRPAATLSALQRHVRAHVARPDLSAESLCRDFGLSRSTLYRLFEPLGGVQAWIRGQRLDEAYRRLTAPGGTNRRVAEVARELGFPSETSFSRDFRRRFDLSPRQATLCPDGPRQAATTDSGLAFRDWIMQT